MTKKELQAQINFLVSELKRCRHRAGTKGDGRMNRKLYAVVYEDSKEVVSRGGSSTPYSLRVFKTIEEAKWSTKQKRRISGDLKIVEYVEGKELEE